MMHKTNKEKLNYVEERMLFLILLCPILESSWNVNFVSIEHTAVS